MKASKHSFISGRFLLIALSVILLPACEKASEPEVKDIARPIKMMTLRGGGDASTLEYPGTVEATRSVEMGFEVPGRIIELPINEGQEVEEGDLLAQLDPVDYQAARDAAESNRMAMSAAYNRAKKIFDQGAGSQAEVDKTLRDIRVAQENLTKAQKALDDTTLTAPFSGQIATKIADNFQNVQAKEVILLLQDISSLEIDVTVPERDFVLATPGLSLEERTERAKPEIVVSSFPGRSFPARFESMSTTADPVTRTFVVTFAFDNPPDITLLPGMTAKVILHLTTGKLAEMGVSGFMVPVSAVAADDQGNAFAWLIDADSQRVSRVAVELGQMAGDQVRVLSGLDGGDTIATAGVHHLREGMQVRPLER